MIEHAGQTKRVDFVNSSLSWGGPSKGIFTLVSLLDYQREDDDQSKHTFGLAQAVLAGNMFVDKELLKDPPYLFQVAGSITEQRIYRSFIPNRAKQEFPHWMKKNLTGDNYGKPLFKEFQLNVQKEKAALVRGFDDVKAFFYRKCFSAKILFKFNDHVVNLEFPVYHISVKPDIKMWQVETGPILFPVVDRDESSLDYMPSFVHFNSFEKLDIFYDYPFGVRSAHFPHEGIITSFPCAIQLFAN